VLVFFHQVGKHWILLVVRKRYTEDVCFSGNVGDKCPTSQLDIIWVSANEADFFAMEEHHV
jgi:hypothetical protein